MTSDHINALFELFGAILITLSINSCIEHKQVKGVHWLPVGFFALWGYWNLWFYPSVEAYWSFYAGILVTVANTVWVSLLIWYSLGSRQR